jgi:hypothetical protein
VTGRDVTDRVLTHSCVCTGLVLMDVTGLLYPVRVVGTLCSSEGVCFLRSQSRVEIPPLRLWGLVLVWVWCSLRIS